MPSRSSSKASQAVDRQLERYRSMRDFHATSEPRGRLPAGARNALPFVVQKHAATRLHYDFRLGWRGVLKSWAVAKGLSFYPGDKRLAVQVEDHPIEYGGFEGTIPKGQYGGGSVMVWDFGDWEPDGDADEGFRKGHLKFELRGARLKGRWALVRMHGAADRNGKANWLLIKEKDSFARAQGELAVTVEFADSAVTHRSMDEIARSEDHVWNSAGSHRSGLAKTAPMEDQTGTTAATKRARSRAKGAAPLRSAPRERLPGFIAPQLAQPASKAPDGDDWIHELKLDGYRIQIHVEPKTHSNGEKREVKLFTRNGLDWTSRMPAIRSAAAQLKVENAILDGEVVVLSADGKTSFADLQAAFQEGRNTDLTYFAFDLLHLDGHNVRDLSLVARKDLLAAVLGSQGDTSPLRLSEHVQAQGSHVFQQACSLGAEGIVSKLSSADYRSGRTGSWLKVKCIQEQEFVIGGFTLSSKEGHGIGALLLGYYEGEKLIYAGRSGTGFTRKTQQMLRARLKALQQKQSAFASIPWSVIRGAHWVKPELVAQVAFATWTRDNLVRQAAFKGIREDKPAAEVVREAVVSASGKSGVATHRKTATGSRSKTRTPGRADMTGPTITHPDKILDAESGMTKRTLADYFLAVADRMLPQIADRPLSVLRCPEGSGKPCFYQKHIGSGLPEGVGSISIPNRKTGKEEEFLTVNTAAGLAGFAQMGVLEIHPWGSRNESFEKPDRVVFDLDPDAAVMWDQLTECARDLRGRLRKLGLVSFLKSTGGKGLHIVVPIDKKYGWPEVKQFAHDVVLGMEKENPALYITKMTKAARKNRIYLDYLRNDRESTAIAPWSPRARSGAPVAIPLEWKELKSAAAPAFHVADFETWRGRLKADPWKGMLSTRQQLPT
jgi:bifunctional non-homologous end joining protein LigD